MIKDTEFFYRYSDPTDLLEKYKPNKIRAVGLLKLGDYFYDVSNHRYTVYSFPSHRSVCGWNPLAIEGQPTCCKVPIKNIRKDIVI